MKSTEKKHRGKNMAKESKEKRERGTNDRGRKVEPEVKWDR